MMDSNPGDDNKESQKESSEYKSTRPKLKLVAVHLGASNSDKVNEKQLELAKRICEHVMKNPTSSCDKTSSFGDGYNQTLSLDAEDAVVRLVELMENESTLNCGYGSNANMQGRIECDASIMSAHNQSWAGIGGVTCCRNPIRLAHSLMRQTKIARPLGLVQPNFLVATGAKQWMLNNCPELCVPESHLLSCKSLSQYQIYKSKYDQVVSSLNKTGGVSASQTHTETFPLVENQLDTVGAIAIDCDNNIACAISSGGVILKHRGRIGQAGVPGAGCWAQDSTATTTTGVGEYLTATLFARLFHEKLTLNKLLHDLGHNVEGNGEEEKRNCMELMISESMNGCFYELLSSPALSHVPAHEKLAGMLTVSYVKNNNCNHGNNHHHRQMWQRQTQQLEGAGQKERHATCNNEESFYLSYGHTTRSLCIGYMTASGEAKSFVSQLNEHGQREEFAQDEREVSDNETAKADCSLSSPMVLMKTLKLNHS